MDAAQMLTAHEIARQCEQLARGAEHGGPRPEEPRPARHLRAVEPITQPIERVPEQPSAPEEESEGAGGSAAGLTDRERELLAFERQWWKAVDSKERAVRELFALEPGEYYRLLEELLDKPAAMRAEPMLVKRLRRERAAGRLGVATARRRPEREY
ncbi:Protein of unknown function [Actinopolyspora xinjiangensis]|uniref:DUF3263 domain-containing protein n=2 Tax=Actinopolyspora xinjiangensis TaxID=405564 RepID=A0A1H0P9P1_9ACTN|nr:Protein of unknown function [Actinopolyspora xinjiangensis]